MLTQLHSSTARRNQSRGFRQLPADGQMTGAYRESDKSKMTLQMLEECRRNYLAKNKSSRTTRCALQKLSSLCIVHALATKYAAAGLVVRGHARTQGLLQFSQVEVKSQRENEGAFIMNSLNWPMICTLICSESFGESSGKSENNLVWVAVVALAASCTSI